MGQACLMLAAAVFAAANCLIVYLHREGGPVGADVTGALTMWNLLAAANLALLCGALVLRRRDWNETILKRIRISEWAEMAALGLVTAAVVPALFFTALVQTSVTNVVIIACLEAPIAYLMTSVFSGREPHSWRVCGSFAAFAGVVLLIFLQGPGGSMSANGEIQLGTGELMAASAAIMLALCTVAYNLHLKHIPMSIYVVSRSALCAPLFLMIGLLLHGPAHLVGLAAPAVWPWVSAYAVIFGLVGPIIWIAGLKSGHPVSVQIASTLTPLAAVAASVAFLQQPPTTTQAIAGIVVLIGLSIGLLGTVRESGAATRSDSATMSALDSGIGFKGV